MCIRIASFVLAALFLCVGRPSFVKAQDSGSRWRTGRYVAADPPIVENPLLSPDDGLDILGAALDTRYRHTGGRDCSHLVHALYERAGFPYPYSNSRELYAGIGQFQAVAQPQPGDLIVWRGHVGIVVSPAKHSFFSALRSGRGVERYDSPYWSRRGRPRFFRYIKDSTILANPEPSAE